MPGPNLGAGAIAAKQAKQIQSPALLELGKGAVNKESTECVRWWSELWTKRKWEMGIEFASGLDLRRVREWFSEKVTFEPSSARGQEANCQEECSRERE